LAAFVAAEFSGKTGERLREQVARDFAHSERVVPGNAPDFFDTVLDGDEERWVREEVRQQQETIKGQGIKLQHFAARFRHLPDRPGPTLLLFLYYTQTDRGLRVEEIPIPD
jgi:anaerobic magnesium-protoporphyrin IX monomethyl ester cyclase